MAVNVLKKSRSPVNVLSNPRTIEQSDEGFWVSTEEQRKSWESKGKMGWFEYTAKQRTSELIPWIPVKAARLTNLAVTADALRKNEYGASEDRIRDEKKLSNYVLEREEERVRGVTGFAKGYRMASEMPAFVLEFLSTGGIASATKKAAEKAIVKTLGSVAERTAGKVVTSGVGIAVSSGTRMIAMPQRYVAGYGERQVNHGLAITDKGIKLLDESTEKPAISAMKSMQDLYIEMLTEEYGGKLLNKSFGWVGSKAANALPKGFSKKTFDAFKKVIPDLKVKDMYTKVGFNGVLEEYGEERMAALLRTMTGLDERDIPTVDKYFEALFPGTEQALIELGVFSIFGGTSIAAQNLNIQFEKRGMLKEESNKILDNLTQTEKETLVEQYGTESKLQSALISDLESNYEDFYTNIVNRMEPIEQLSKVSRKEGIDIEPGKDPQFLSRSYLGLPEQVRATLEDKTFRIDDSGNIIDTGEGLKPILDTLDVKLDVVEPNKNIRADDFQKYLKATRFINDLVPREDVKVTDKQKLQSVIDLAELTDKYGDEIHVFDEVSSRLYGYQQRVLSLLISSGNLAQSEYDAIINKNQHYIPFDRVLEEVDLISEFSPKGKGRFQRTKSPIKKIIGSEKEIENVYTSVIRNTIRIMDTASRNRVARSVADLADFLPDYIRRKKGPKEKTLTLKGNIIEYYEDGKRKFMEVSPQLFTAMTGMQEATSNLLVKILAFPAQTLRVGATITPEFMSRNFFRDQFTAAIQSNIGFRPFIDSFTAISDIMGKTDLYYDWLKSGAAYAGIIQVNRQSLDKAYKELSQNKKAISKLNIIARLQDASQLFEQATRVGIYKAAKRKGLSDIAAAFESREGTLDFARKGSKTANFNAVKAFLNAQIQAADKLSRIHLEDPLGTAMKASAYITIPSLILYLVNRDDKEYKEIPRWQKDLFWNFKANNIWWKIPKPFGLGQVYGSLPERMFEYIDSRDPDSFNEIHKSLWESLSPAQGADSLIPTAVLPILEWITNFNFFLERPVVSESKQKLSPKEQAGRFTSETAKQIGAALNVSPSKVDNLIRGYTGTSGQYALESTDFLMNSIKKAGGENIPEKVVEPADLPVIRGFASRSPYGTRSKSTRQFYDLMRDMTQAHNDQLLYKRENRSKDLSRLKKDKALELSLYKDFNDIRRFISKLTGEITKIENSDLNVERKKRVIRIKEKKITSISNQAIVTYNKKKSLIK